MVELKTFFERCYMINLARCSDRWKQIQRNVMPFWPLTTIERWPAVDGQVVSRPTWWKASKGAWGCYRSHAGIIERCLNEGVKSVLILEDDAVLCDNFTVKIAKFLAAVPDDWDMIYLGGNLRKAPQKIDTNVYRAFGVGCTHAMAISAKGMSKVYQWLHPNEWPGERKRRFTIDGHLRKFHDQSASRIYVPAQWLIGQNAGRSNIMRRKNLKLRFWRSAAREDAPQEFAPAPISNVTMPNITMPNVIVPNVIAVVGPFRSGTSCVAGMLHTLGVSMGRQFFRGRPKSNPKGFFEAKSLRKVCIESYHEPLMQPLSESKDRVHLLQQWALGRIGDGNPIGAKHPALCLCVPEMMEAWPDVKIVSVTRGLDATSASLKKTGWWPKISAKAKCAALANMIATRDADIERLKPPVLKLDFSEVLANPKQTVENFIAFAGISPTPAQIEAATAFVDPSLNHNPLTGDSL